MVFIFTSFFIIVKETFAATTYNDTFYDSPPASHAECIDRSGCSAPDTCWNSASVGSTNCGTACNGGDAWTKYQFIGCFQTFYDQDTGVERCERAHLESGDTCSTADKCQYQPYLRAGRCDCSTGGTYKTCCTGDGNVNGSCVQSGTQDNNSPPEGSCPSGSTTVMCGVSSGTCNAVYPYPCTTASCGGDACSILRPDPPLQKML